MRAIKALVPLMLLGVLAGLVSEAPAAERKALVIGNGAYAHAPYLRNPGRDARAVADALKGLGFAVTGPLADLGKAELEKALLGFGERAQGAAAVVVYYAGHGVEVGGQNYLVPVDARLERASAVALEAVALEALLEQLRGAGRYRLVILDACRDNPLADRMRRPDGTRSLSRGLARVEAGESQTYVAYAAKAGTQAQEGTGEHSPYTAALLKHLAAPLPLERLFGAVREEVLAATQHQQEPYLYGAFGREPIYLGDAPTAAPAAPAIDPRAVELSYWESIKASQNPAYFLEYLRQFPQGAFVGLAQIKLRELEVASSQKVTALSPASPQAGTDDQSLQSLRQAAESGNAESQLKLGLKFASGDGVAIDYTEAIKWYRKAAEQNNPTAQYKLGAMFDKGQGVSQDYFEAGAWYLKAAERGDAAAQFALGVYYENGSGFAQDDAKAMAYYRKAAEQNHTDAQLSLGLMYLKINNNNEGMLWLDKAAKNGNITAQTRLGILYFNQKNYGQASQWFIKAAEKNNPVAQFHLGGMHYLGIGVKKNYTNAYLWLKLASLGKVSQADELIAKLSGQMTAKQIKDGEELIRKWSKK